MTRIANVTPFVYIMTASGTSGIVDVASRMRES